MKKHDPVNSPVHYTAAGGLECIDAIEAAMSTEQFQGWLRGNVLKYLWRYPYKNNIEDLQKAKFYLNRLITVKLDKECKANNRE